MRKNTLHIVAIESSYSKFNEWLCVIRAFVARTRAQGFTIQCDFGILCLKSFVVVVPGWHIE